MILLHSKEIFSKNSQILLENSAEFASQKIWIGIGRKNAHQYSRRIVRSHQASKNFSSCPGGVLSKKHPTMITHQI